MRVLPSGRPPTTDLVRMFLYYQPELGSKHHVKDKID